MKKVTDDASTHKIAAKMGDGTSPATVNRWQESRPAAEKVVTFCRKYNVDPLEGLFQAGYITEAELKRPHLANLTSAQLIAELAARDAGQR